MKRNLVVTLLLGFSISVFSQTYDINGDYKISGKVGIGTTSPNVKLNINGAGEIIKISDNIQIVSTDYTLGAFEIQSLDNSIESVNFRISAITEDATGAASMVFGTGRREENAPEKMRIMSNGNVGIGTTNTFGYKLAVNGTIGAKEVVVETTNPWSDFVFEPNYSLMPLNELNTYIQENKHLPEIPTTAEVEENGISVGEMNAKLLQKIEELTLYMIEQNKKTETLIMKVETLESKNATLESEIKKMKSE